MEQKNGYALITGASRGIGRAIAHQLASNGFNLLLNFKSNYEMASSLLNELTRYKVTCELCPFDVSNQEEVSKSIGNWFESNPNNFIEILINNSGINKDNLLPFMPLDDWNQVLQTNLNSFFYITKEVINQMIRQRKGRIINMVSLSGIKGMPGQTNYAASKAGLIGATKSLALELAKRNITVNAIAPGFIETDMTSKLDKSKLIPLVPMNRFGEPHEVASLVGFLASKQASYITGQVISINGGLYT